MPIPRIPNADAAQSGSVGSGCAPAHRQIHSSGGDCSFEMSTYKEHQMLETVAILLLILWALGLVSSYTLGGFIHILLVIAVIVILVRLIRGRSPL